MGLEMGRREPGMKKGKLRHWLWSVSLMLSMLAACDQQEEGKGKANQPPRVVKIRLLPESAQPGDTLSANVEVRDRELDNYTIEYEWYENESLMADRNEDHLDTTDLAPGTRVYFRARGVEKASGAAGEWDKSNTVVLGEPSGPRLAGVSIEPDRLTAQSTARAVVHYGETDPYTVDEVYYRWQVNGEFIAEDAGSGPELYPGNFARGTELSWRCALMVALRIPTNGSLRSKL
jgi:hypothetical protein